jgi:hypothetical protein
VTARKRGPPVGRECDRIDFVGMSLDRVSGGNVPQLDRLVYAARQRGVTVWRENDCIVSRVADYGLIEVADLNGNMTIDRSDRAKIACAAIAADPYGWSFRQGSPLLRFEPLVKLDGASAHIGMGGSRHLQSCCTFKWRARSSGRTGLLEVMHEFPVQK